MVEKPLRAAAQRLRPSATVYDTCDLVWRCNARTRELLAPPPPPAPRDVSTHSPRPVAPSLVCAARLNFKNCAQRVLATLSAAAAPSRRRTCSAQPTAGSSGVPSLCVRSRPLALAESVLQRGHAIPFARASAPPSHLAASSAMRSLCCTKQRSLTRGAVPGAQ